ncbi:hypothetical protein ACM16X_08875 [Haloarcula japonica]|uniref:hypothetical protein n=1 Tax=Haloarcula japonica TaxID=29282 RepID=UPI0039F65E1B
MNLSLTRLEDVDGDAFEERPQYVEDALEAPRKVGKHDGKPLVSDGDIDLKLGDNPRPHYEHYPSADDMLLPPAGDFLYELAEQPEIWDTADIADELNVDEERVEKALELHGITIGVFEGSVSADGSDSSTASDGTDADEEEQSEMANGVPLPSGETVSKSLLSDPVYTDKLLLSALFGNGMSVREVSLYLSEYTDENPSVSDIRDAAEEHSILGDGTDESGLRRGPRGKRVTSDGQYVSDPWS